MTARENWEREIARLWPEILRSSVAYALAGLAEQVFAEYDVELKGTREMVTDLADKCPLLASSGAGVSVHAGTRVDCPVCGSGEGEQS
jgi:hypothetical protein